MNLKQARGQLRQLIKELLPELLSQELKSALYAELTKVISARLSAVEEDIKSTMHDISERSKATSDYVFRNVQAPVQMPEVSDESIQASSEAPSIETN